MSAQWRLFLEALRFVVPGLPAALVSVDLPSRAATKFVPLAGMALGLVCAAIYWIGADLWPTSVALILCILPTVPPSASAWYWVFFLFLRYNALMALSAANLPVALPEHFTLGLILIGGQAASRAMVVSVLATHAPGARRMSTADLAFALMIGLSPAALLGIPGLVGLAIALAARLGVQARPVLPALDVRRRLELTQQLTETGFYLGALASWKYV